MVKIHAIGDALLRLYNIFLQHYAIKTVFVNNSFLGTQENVLQFQKISIVSQHPNHNNFD